MEQARSAEAALVAPESTRRCAVIAVHGIADQARGVTAESVALQIAAAANAPFVRSDLPLDVPPIDPVVGYTRWLPQGLAERIRKSWRQSMRSDFLRQRIGAHASDAEPKRNSARAGADESADAGVRYSDYLFAKSATARNGRHEEHAAPEHSFAQYSVAGAGTTETRTDVFDMYWADLSRLPGSVMRIVTELFTLLFRLSRLGVDTLALEATVSGHARLGRLHRMQRATDWLFSRVLALLALQLVMCALLLAAAALIPARPIALSVALALAAGLAVAASLVYRRRWPWQRGMVAGVLTLLAVALPLAHPQSPLRAYAHFVLVLLWLAAQSLLYLRFIAYCEERFRAVYGVGLVLYALTLAGVLLFGAGWLPVEGTRGWIAGTLATIEAVLLLHAILWGLLGLLLAATVLLGESAASGNDAHAATRRQVVVTARLGLFTSIGAFLAFWMIAWGLASAGLEALLGDASYHPWWFEPIAVESTMRGFLQERYLHSSASFSAVSLLLLGLAGFISIVFAPSMLIELRRAAPSASRLGAWLTTGYHSVERFVRWWGVAVALVAVAAGALLWLSQWARHTGAPLLPPGSAAGGAVEWSAEQSRQWLSGIVKTIAGGAIGLLALGGAAARQLQRVRAPLDAVLDVDKHFREFPREAIPRVRIFERYVALLDHVLASGYGRIVIVAHSQGTVITAELLRYLRQRARLVSASHDGRPAPGGIDLARLAERLAAADVRLLTVGSPLRQLYALRFPRLYGWVLGHLSSDERAGPGVRGPLPSELGVRAWTNLWASGDYVGRWLWSSGSQIAPLALSVAEARYRSDVVELGFDAAGAAWRDRCIGAGAHTHYFDLEQVLVREELMALVDPSPQPSPQRGEGVR